MNKVAQLAAELGRDADEPGTSRLIAAIENGELPKIDPDPFAHFPQRIKELAHFVWRGRGDLEAMIIKLIYTEGRLSGMREARQIVDSTASKHVGHTLNPSGGGPCE